MAGGFNKIECGRGGGGWPTQGGGGGWPTQGGGGWPILKAAVWVVLKVVTVNTQVRGITTAKYLKSLYSVSSIDA